MGWHLRTGEWIVNNLQIPTYDPFLFTHGKWIANQWLSDLIFWGAYSFRGWPLLEWIVGAVGITILFFILPALISSSKLDRKVQILPLFFTIINVSLLINTQWILRPVIFSFLLFAITFLVGNKMTVNQNRSKTNSILFFFLFLLWANLHPAFPLGIGLLGVFFVGKYLDQAQINLKIVLPLLILSAIATLFNPYFFSLHQEIWKLLTSPYFMNLNIEWLPPTFAHSEFWPFFGTIFLLPVFVLLISKSKNRFSLILPVLVFALLALSSRRYIPYFGITLAPLLYHSLCEVRLLRIFSPPTELPYPKMTSALILFFLIYVISINSLPGKTAEQSNFEKYYPADAVNVLLDEIKRADSVVGKTPIIFASPNYGGYLTFKLWPNAQVFIDDRNELNGVARYEEYFQALKGGEQASKILDEYTIDYLLIEKDTKLNQMIDRSLWRELYSNNDLALYKRL